LWRESSIVAGPDTELLTAPLHRGTASSFTWELHLTDCSQSPGVQMVRGMHEYCALDSAKQASDNETLPFFSYTAERRSLSACQFHCVGASGEQASRDSHTLARPFICSFKARLAPVHPPGPALILSFSFLMSLSLSLSSLFFSASCSPLSCRFGLSIPLSISNPECYTLSSNHLLRPVPSPPIPLSTTETRLHLGPTHANP